MPTGTFLKFEGVKAAMLSSFSVRQTCPSAAALLDKRKVHDLVERQRGHLMRPSSL